MGVSVKELTNAMASSLADAIERSDGTWTKPYSATGPRMPHNPVTGRSYSGMNWFVLAAAANGRSIDHGGWATYRQWQKAECQVRKGEYSVRVIRVAVAKCCGEKACNEGSRCGVTPRKWVKVYPVFSATQVDGDVPVAAGYERDAPEWDHTGVTELFGGSGARWQIQDGIVPHYDLKTDIITVPPPEAFHSAGAWASTLAHEHAHWTGPRTGRLKDRVGSDEARAREELVAELAAVVICSALGVEHEPVEYHADYLRSWASHLRGEDGGAALAAASADAARAAAVIVGAITKGIQEREAAAKDRPEPAVAGIAARAAAPAGDALPARVAVGRWMLSRSASRLGAGSDAAARTFADLLAIPSPSFHPDVAAPTVEQRLVVRAWMLGQSPGGDAAEASIDRILELTPTVVEQAQTPPAPTRAAETAAETEQRETDRGRGGYDFGW